MQRIGLLMALAIPAAAQAQALKPEDLYPPAANTVRTIDPDLGFYRGWGWNDTPTMREQRQKRVDAFRYKVAARIADDGGTLTPDSRAWVRREWEKLRYRNR